MSTNGSLVANVGGLLSEETLIKRIVLVSCIYLSVHLST